MSRSDTQQDTLSNAKVQLNEHSVLLKQHGDEKRRRSDPDRHHGPRERAHHHRETPQIPEAELNPPQGDSGDSLAASACGAHAVLRNADDEHDPKPADSHCIITLNNGTALFLREVNRSLALVCILKSHALAQQARPQ